MKRDRRSLAIVGMVLCCILSGCGEKVVDEGKGQDSGTVSEKVESSGDTTEVNKQTEETTTVDKTTEQEDGTQQSEKETTKVSDTENQVETESSTTESQTTVTAPEEETKKAEMKASLLNTYYAGDVLTAADFSVEITKEDGQVEINPQGWYAYPLELVEGENKIRVVYREFCQEIIVKVEARPEVNVGQTTSGVRPEDYILTGSAVLQPTEDMGQEYLDKIVFLGDSRTYSYKAYGVLSGGRDTTQVWTPKSGTMTLASQSYALIDYPETGQDLSIRDAVALKKPEYMVIGLGTNGLSFMTKDVFKAEYTSLINDIKAISPNTKIMINSIFPVASYYGSLESINNSKIIECNKWLVEVAEETGTRYLNTAEVLVDDQGWIDMAYDNGGGAIHLNKLGNEVVMNYIRTHGYK